MKGRVEATCYHCWCSAAASSYDVLFWFGWNIVPVFGEWVWLCPTCQLAGK